MIDIRNHLLENDLPPRERLERFARIRISPDANESQFSCRRRPATEGAWAKTVESVRSALGSQAKT